MKNPFKQFLFSESRKLKAGSYSRGVTLIDTVVGVALMLLVFIGITAAFQLSLDVVTNNKIRAGAIALLNERMEYLRSLSYTQIGVEGGIPSGIVPQIETVSWNGANYTRRTSVLYSDDPQDGLGSADTNDIIADYKTIRVEVSWDSRSGERSVELVGRVSPSGIETAVPGGILTISVVSEAAAALSNAQVDIINTQTAPSISIRTYTNANGMVSFIGAPAASNYQITVSRPGYSSAQTYPVTAENPNPNPRHLTVADTQTTSATFTIDFTGTKTVQTYMQVREGTWTDTMSDGSKIAAMSSTTVAAGVVELEGSPGSYPSLGTLQSISISPAYLARWKEFTAATTTPVGTGITFRFYDGTGINLIPDAQLPGNSGGLVSGAINLSGISTSTYPALRVTSTLTSSDPNETPAIGQYSFIYDHGPEPFPNLSFTMRGLKTIGNNPTVYKYDQTHISNASALLTLSDVEADTYMLGVATTTGYNLAESCNPQPEVLLPGGSQITRLYVLPYAANTLLVDVRSNTSALLSGASVRLYTTGYDTTLSTSQCGQTFFEDLEVITYSISVSKAGYQTYDSSAVNVSDVSQFSVTLNSL